MPTPFAPRRLAQALLFLALFCLAAGPAAADLIWEPATGWRAEGGVLEKALASEPKARNALELMNKARAAEEDGDKAEALSLYQKVAKDYASSAYTPEALFRSGGLLVRKHKYKKAFAAYQKIIEQHPAYPKFDDTINAQYRIADALAGGARGRIFGFIPGFQHRGRGLEYFEKVVQNAPYSPHAPLALMNLARGYQRADDPDAAIDALDRMINNYPDNFLAPDAYLRLAKAHADLVAGPPYDQGASRRALTYYEDFMLLFPQDPGVKTAANGQDAMRTALAESKMVMAYFYDHYRSNYTAARVLYSEAVTLYPESPVARRAHERIDRIDAILARREQDAAKRDPVAPPAKKRFWLF